jgi:hypothetical protein
LFGDAVRHFPSIIASTFDPSFFEQTLQGNARVRKLFGFHPAAASQPLHELAFAMVGDDLQ